MKFFDMLNVKEVASIIEPQTKDNPDVEPEIDTDGEESGENGGSESDI